MNYRIFALTMLAFAGTLGFGFAATALAESMPTSDASETVVAPAKEIAQATGDIVDVASANEDFSTLVAAVKAAELVDALKGDGPLTVFAPTNEAFAELPDGVVEALLLPENQDLLVDVLKYHVVSGEILSTDLETSSVESLNGGLAVQVTSEGVIVNNASVVQADIDASNGVIHVINRVLIPVGVATELQSRMASTSPSEPIQALW